MVQRLCNERGVDRVVTHGWLESFCHCHAEITLRVTIIYVYIYILDEYELNEKP